MFLLACLVENHLASNIHKSRLVQQDLRVAKRLQEEEDQWAKAQSHKQHQDMWAVQKHVHITQGQNSKILLLALAA